MAIGESRGGLGFCQGDLGGLPPMASFNSWESFGGCLDNASLFKMIALFAEALTEVENSICLRTSSTEGVATLVAARVLPYGSVCLGFTRFLFGSVSLPSLIIHFGSESVYIN